MPLVATSFTLTTPDIKWALVTVGNPDGSINREYTITAEEANAVKNSKKSGPPGCTKEEWESGRVGVTARPLTPGLFRVLPDNTLVLNYGINPKLSKISVDVLRIPKSDYEIKEGVLWLDSKLAKAIDKGVGKWQ